MGLKTEEDKLFKACLQGRVKSVQELISSSLSTADNFVNNLSSEHKTPLYYSIISNSYQLVRLLIKHGTNVNKSSTVFYGKDCSSPSFETCFEPPVVTASRIGSTEILRCLLRNGGDPNSHHMDLRKSLEVATHSLERPRRHFDERCKKDSSISQSLQSRLSSSCMGYFGMSALHSACESCQMENVRLLLKHGANVNAVEGRKFERPLHLASRCQRELCETQCDIIELLCQHGADLEVLSKKRQSPFYLAALYGCEKKVGILLKHGANPNSHLTSDLYTGEPCDWGGYGSAMHVAAYKDFLSLAVVLINCGADINSVNSTGMTPLYLNISVRNRSNVAALLIFHGALLDDRPQITCPHSHASQQSSLYSNEGKTLLSRCLLNPRLDCESLAILLVQAGYDLNKDPWLIPEFDSSDISPEYSISEHGLLRIRSAISSPAECRVSRLCKWLRMRQQSVKCLSEICRTFIRRHLVTCGGGKSIVAGVNLLPLPNALKNFILLKSRSGKNLEEAILNCFREL